MARQASSRRAAAGSSDRQDARRNAQVGSRTGRSRALLPRRDRKYTRTARQEDHVAGLVSSRASAATHCGDALASSITIPCGSRITAVGAAGSMPTTAVGTNVNAGPAGLALSLARLALERRADPF